MNCTKLKGAFYPFNRTELYVDVDLFTGQQNARVWNHLKHHCRRTLFLQDPFTLVTRQKPIYLRESKNAQ